MIRFNSHQDKRWFFTASILTIFFLAFLVNGCIFDSVKKMNNDNTQTQVPNMEDEFGGYKVMDEAPGFGDPEILDEFGEDQEVVDLLSQYPQIASHLEDPVIDVYFLRITWGMLQGDTSAVNVTDWSGKAKIDQGILVLLKTIRFEGGDYIHRPRPDRQTLEWTSYTGPHFDGICIAIVVPPEEPVPVTAEGSFTFSTTPFTRTFSFSELESIDVVYTVDEYGNEISFVGHKKQLVPCGGGFLEGRWISMGPNHGRFFGKWINRDGTLSGHLKGHWGIRENGEKVFFGKYISTNGEFKGLLRGRWGYGEKEGRGWFFGHWYDRHHRMAGILKGHFRTGMEMNRKGFFHGVWRRFCPPRGLEE
ncbi:MAG: hypothetical protein ACE5K2_04135 [Candidatus Zixiibacteriota bacterium]